MMMTSFYNKDEIIKLGLKSSGKNVLISRFAKFYGSENICIGDNVRIDDFCILSGHINIGNNIHISAFVALYGNAGITLEDYSGVSSYSTIYSTMDDFGGDYLIGPVHPEQFTNVITGEVIIKKYSQVGTHCVIFPGVTIGEGSVLGAMTFVKKNIPEWGIYIGQPAKLLKPRSKGLLKLI